METLHIVKERIGAPNEAAAKREVIASKNTLAVAAAAASGARVLEYTRVIEDTHNGPQNVVTFALDETFLEFRPDFAAENVSVGEFLRRIRDDAWVAANPNHPIAYMAHALEGYKRLTRAIRQNSPMLQVVHGKTRAFLNLRGDRDYQRRIMRQAGFSDADIEAVIAQLEGRS